MQKNKKKNYQKNFQLFVLNKMKLQIKFITQIYKEITKRLIEFNKNKKYIRQEQNIQMNSKLLMILFQNEKK